MNFARTPKLIGICFLLGCLVFLCSALWINQSQLTRNIENFLNQELPKAVESGLQSRINQPGEVEQLINRIDGDLQNVPVKQSLKTVQTLWVRLETLGSATPSDTHVSFVTWKTGDQQRVVTYTWGYKIYWLPLILEALVWSLLLAAIYILIPRPISPHRQRWLIWLVKQGESRKRAKLLTADLTEPLSDTTEIWLTHLVAHVPFVDALLLSKAAAKDNISIEQLPWLVLGWKLESSTIETAISISKSPLCLEFDLSQQLILIHGFPINMSQTPLFYYLWYALQRELGEGWVLNPSSQHADESSAKSLVALMRDYQGHTKAIAELDEQGLRAKTLDQNRSKIKDALCSALGNELASQFLFENEKDKRTGRSRYRLMQALPVSILDRAIISHVTQSESPNTHV